MKTVVPSPPGLFIIEYCPPNEDVHFPTHVLTPIVAWVIDAGDELPFIADPVAIDLCPEDPFIYCTATHTVYSPADRCWPSIQAWEEDQKRKAGA